MRLVKSLSRTDVLHACTLLIVASLMLCAGCGPKADKRLATPKDSARTLFQAMYDGDIKLAKACIVEGPGQAELAEGLTEMTVAMRRATDAAYKRFGEEFRKAAGGAFDTNHIATGQIDTAIEAIRGDGASLKIEEKQMNLQLVRKDGEWKTDLIASFSGQVDLRTAENREMMRGGFKAMAAAADKTKSQIEAGKYKNANQTIQALSKNMETAIKEEDERLSKSMPH